MSENTRELVLDMLMEVTRQEHPSHVVHSQMLMKYQYLEKQERRFMSRLFKGTLERMVTLDYVIGRFSSVKVSKIKPVLKNILRMSVYQILYMESIPHSAACNEAVKLAVRRGFKNLRGFVNGVLRNISRNVDQIPWPDREMEPELYLSVIFSVPQWLGSYFIETFGFNQAETILKDSLAVHPVTVRCVDEEGVQETVKILEQEGVKVDPGVLLPYALQISGFDSIGELKSFQEGRYAVQDESSMMVVEMAGICRGDTVMDVCAAPGGKSCHAGGKLLSMAQGTGDQGHVYARDVSYEKVELIEDNVRRLGLPNVTVQVRDALVLNSEDVGKADVVLADLPCSGLGVIGKKPDIKYRITRQQITQLAALQRQILSVVQNYVAPGKTLIYSTCTVTPEENMENAVWFEKNFGFKLEESRQFFQGIDGCDGFFIARFRKMEPEG